MNDLTPYPKPSLAYSAMGEMALELAKILALVAPTSMTTDQQEIWLRAAVDALQDIRPDEVRAISAELRRSVTRHNQVVPEIARLVSNKRARSNGSTKPVSPFMAEREINREAQARRAKAKTQRGINEAHEWERNARADAGLSFTPAQRPLSRAEMEAMPAHVLSLGLKSGFLKRVGNAVVEVESPEEIDRFREQNRR